MKTKVKFAPIPVNIREAISPSQAPLMDNPHSAQNDLAGKDKLTNGSENKELELIPLDSPPAISRSLGEEDMAEYARYLYRTARNPSEEAIFVTSHPNDMLGSPIDTDTIADLPVSHDQETHG